MLKIERQKFIENELEKSGSIIISEISKQLECSEETIRRDLKEMESKNLLKRTHGGAFLPESDDKGIPFKLREMYYPETKDNISKFVIKNFINENETIMLDCSSTCLSLAKNILETNINITIITNSLRIIMLFEEKPRNAKLIAIGGTYRKRSSSFNGYQSTESLSKYVADKSFISCSAVSYTHGLLDNNQNESQIRKIYINNSKKRFLIADHTKFEDFAEYIISPTSVIDNVVTDKKLELKWEELFEKEKINIDYIN